MREEFSKMLKGATKIGPCYYDIPAGVKKIMARIPARPVHAGLRVACVNRVVKPSPAALEQLKDSLPCVTVNAKSAWLFVCGRDILKKGVVKHDEVKSGDLALVCDEQGHALGYGQVRLGMKGAIASVKRLFDLGDYLRRE